MATFATTIGCGAGIVALTGLGARKSVHFIGKDEQLIEEAFTETVVHNGPGVKILNPLSFRGAQKVKARMLGDKDFLKVSNAMDGTARIEQGPQLFFPGPYERIAEAGSGITLSPTEYLIVVDMMTGAKSIVKGPRIWFPKPHDSASQPQTAIALQSDEFIRLKDVATGERWVQKGKALLFLEPTWVVEKSAQKAWTLKANEYVRFLNKVSGKVVAHHGEQTVFPGPDEELLDNAKLSAINLNVDEYIKIEDRTDGSIRVATGPSKAFLGPLERVFDDDDEQSGQFRRAADSDYCKKKAVQVDEEHAALVRERRTGQLRLITEKQLFVPGPTEVIEEVRDLIKLADHEAMIIKDNEGHFHFHFGDPDKETSDRPRSFFLQPYEEIEQLAWSSGLRRKKRDLFIDRFDCRPQYMWNEIDCRTSDNVELILECTFFWEVTDLAKMVRSTGNLPGDIYNQARSQFIKSVAHKKLKEFMEDLHKISEEVFFEGTQFYDARGIKIHSLEVTSYRCAEDGTREVLQQIIEETTNRMNRLSQAESENEVNIHKITGQMELEKQRAGLLQLQHAHAQAEARVGGAAEAERVKAFVKGLEDGVPKLEDRVAMWQVLRKTEALSVVSAGGASLYYTPNDVNLSIETKPSAAEKS